MRMTLADYGVGNLHSIKKALELNGASVTVATDMKDLLGAECIIFPGVGAFDKTMEKLLPYREGITERLKAGVPALGVCIGMQILFESSAEGTSPGLGLYDGNVVKIDAKLVPHMGWNEVVSDDALFDGVESRYFYFANSYHGCPKDRKTIIGTTEYEGKEFPSFFRKYNTYGAQFHPEKSAGAGQKVLENFIDFAEGQV